jgi:hypothetical protein
MLYGFSETIFDPLLYDMQMGTSSLSPSNALLPIGMTAGLPSSGATANAIDDRNASALPLSPQFHQFNGCTT